LKKEIYKLKIELQTFLDQIGEVLEMGPVKSIRNRRACMRNLMTVEEAKVVCKDRSKWKKLISA
jgi:signal recognition particle GTPase